MADRRVVIVAKWIPHYRVAFLDHLRSRLAADGVSLEVLYGHAPRGVAAYDDVELLWGHRVRLTVLRMREQELYWPHVLRRTAGADLVIVEQANRVLVNYPLLLLQRVGRRRIAFWGHGRNFEQRAHGSISERLKRRLAAWPHWWFAYTQASLQPLAEAGVDPARITVVDNAIDTADLAATVKTVTPTQIQAARRGCTGRLGVFVGTLYAEKRLDLLLAAADRVVEQVPDFGLIVAGDGPERQALADAAVTRPWLKVVGPLFGPEKAALLRAADVMLMPGRVGLVVLDAFVAGVPMVTRNAADHAPEVSYVADGDNAVVVREESAEAFAMAVVALLSDDDARLRLAAGARRSAARYTVEAMAEKFATGVLQALQAS